MPAKRESDIAKPAAEKKIRARKPRAAAPATPKAQSKPRASAAKTSDRPSTPRRRSASPRKSPQQQPATAVAAQEAKTESEAPVIASVPTPILPVSPREPAAADATSNAAQSAAPVPDHSWSWAGAPIAATVAFLATLGALLLGYWTGYSVGSEAMGKSGKTIVEASEKAPAAAMPAEPAPAAVEPKLEELASEPAEGLHLQVSALSSERAADSLRRQLEGRGFPVRVEAPKEDDLVRVYVGPIADSDDLNKWASELRNQGLKPFPKRL